MNQTNFKKGLFTFSFFLSLFFGYAQADSRNLITLKFSEYNVETDKIIQKEFSKKDGFKSVYTCIPAGVIVLETDNPITDQVKEFVSTKLNSLKKSLNYKVLEGLTLKQAEENCSSIRNIEK